MTDRLILGQVLQIDADPSETGPEAIGQPPTPRCRSTIIGEDLILPGFIDAHAHYPQTAIIASWGKRLIDWLNTYTFPEEMRFSDPAYAAGDRSALSRPRCWPMARRPSAATAPSTPKAWRRSSPRPQARGCAPRRQDLHGPQRARGLRDTAQRAYDDSKRAAHALAWARTGWLRDHAALLTHLDRGTAGRAGRALGRTPRLPDADPSLRTDRRDRLGPRALPRRRATTSTPTRRTGFWARTASTATPSTWTARTRPAGGGGRGAGPLPHLQHLHRLGALRHGRAQRPPARGAGHRHRRRVLLFHAAHHGRGLRDRAACGTALHPASFYWLATGASARALGQETRSAISPGEWRPI
jgi:hypothetical protein